MGLAQRIVMPGHVTDIAALDRVLGDGELVAGQCAGTPEEVRPAGVPMRRLNRKVHA